VKISAEGFPGCGPGFDFQKLVTNPS